eukprot:scaffold2089_cov336-Prasinococcus_capsulatus_cf.AAC.9
MALRQGAWHGTRSLVDVCKRLSPGAAELARADTRARGVGTEVDASPAQRVVVELISDTM